MLAKRITRANVHLITRIEISSQIMVRVIKGDIEECRHVGEIGMICYNPLDLDALKWTVVFTRGQVGSDYPSLELLLKNEIDRGEFEFFFIEII
jgi:hypothetical protein